MPAYYRHTLANGKTVMETAPTIQWGYLIYLTVLRLCQYFGAKEECRFCDINHNWRQHKQAGRPYTGIKPVEDVLEALAIIAEHDDGASHAYTLTGGSVTLEGRRARRGGLLRALRAGDRGALPGPLDRQGRRAGAAARGRAALQGLRDLDLPPELRGLGRAPVLDHLPRQGALRRAGGVAPADPRRGRGVRAAPRDPELRRRRGDGEAVRVRVGRRRDRAARSRGSTSSCRAGSRRGSRRGARSRRRRSAATTRRARRSSTTCGCSRPTATRSSGTACSRRPGTASPGAGNAVFSVSSFMDVLAAEVGGAGMSIACRSRRRASSGCAATTRSLASARRGARALARPAARPTWSCGSSTTRTSVLPSVTTARSTSCPNQDGGYVLSREDVFAKIDELLEVGGDLVGVQRRLQPEAAARLLLRPVRVGARALRRPGRVLRADGRRVRVPRGPRRAVVRGGRCAAARCGRPLGDRRRSRDPHRGLPQAARQVEVHGRRTTSRRSGRSSRAG